jgi:hypothetical protein
MRYRIVYQIPGLHRVPREAVIILLDSDSTAIHGHGSTEFGTVSIERRYVSAMEQVGDDERCYADRKVRA